MRLRAILSLFLLLGTSNGFSEEKTYQIPDCLKFHNEDAARKLGSSSATTVTPDLETVETTPAEKTVEMLNKVADEIETAFQANSSRKEIYKKWKEAIDEANKTVSANLKPNQFAYLTRSELETHLLGFEAAEGITSQVNQFSYPPKKSKLGNSADPPVYNGPGERPDYWEILNWDTLYPIPAKDQGYCGSCWAFVGAYILEHWHMRNTGQSYADSSEQQAIACPHGTNGCIGGDPRKMLKHNIVST